ncbi:hypothetical protein HanXRQr2_Chr12g0532061 [Helianthus annuus]|uniref:Uncharacterized protein n=1 Tax=Helianthus annuus TaxID=4232 RepID=A0A9K3HF33_HELAN|nr:hypothetical protein HanXRQr2_Chr12g0532061 [Helianthus annuus]
MIVLFVYIQQGKSIVHLRNLKAVVVGTIIQQDVSNHHYSIHKQ